MESNNKVTSISETLNINKFRFRVEFGTIEDHEINIHKVFNESGIMIIRDSFHFHIVDQKKWLLAKIKYGF